MVFYWTGLTVVAIYLTAVSVALTLLPLPLPGLEDTAQIPTCVKLRMTMFYAIAGAGIALLYISGIKRTARAKHGDQVWD
jgi:hypothetical protein